jgi:hypothetical protein
MSKYDRIVGTFYRKVSKLQKLAEKNSAKIQKYMDKAERIKARIDAKIANLESKGQVLNAEASKAKGTAKKLEDLLD